MVRPVAIVIPVRLASSRLPRKHLIEAAGRPLLQWLVERQQAWVSAEQQRQRRIVIATTTQPTDDDVAALADALGVSVFRGDVLNVAKRLAEAARSVGTDAFVCVDGDDIACSPRAVAAAAALLDLGVPRVSVEGLPFGMNAAGYSVQLIEAALAGTNRKIVQTGWSAVLQEAPVVIRFPEAKQQTLRFTLDYPEDGKFFKALIEYFGVRFSSVSDEALVDAAISQGLVEINRGLDERYWEHYRRELESEIGS